MSLLRREKRMAVCWATSVTRMILICALTVACAERTPAKLGQCSGCQSVRSGEENANSSRREFDIRLRQIGASVGFVSASRKVRPRDRFPLSATARLLAAQNEFEAVQLVISARRAVRMLRVTVDSPLRGPNGAEISSSRVWLYRVGYYDVKVASNSEGSAGRWPDPLIPDVDPYVGERRRAFPMNVPAGENRSVWVDIHVPQGQTPGTYEGSLVLHRGSEKLGRIGFTLRVGRFRLPSTASLATAFQMDYEQPCMAHTGTDTCDKKWNNQKAYELRERYVRAGLEHRFSIYNIAFQPPHLTEKLFVRYMVPFINGSARTRLRGARVTSVRLDDDRDLDKWIAFARKYRFLDRLLYFPVDEPANDAENWEKFLREARKLHGFDPKARILLTAPLAEVRANKALEHVDLIVPVVNHIEGRSEEGNPYAGNQRALYDKWLGSKQGRAVWGYQSCMSHGCGECGQPSPSAVDRGWPNRVIDTSAVQNRAFPWLAFLFDLSGELYFEVAEQLSTAWDPNGQCKFSGSGDGTLLYPGTPDRIGGRTDIPITSIRVKMIREGIEDYEYLKMVAKQNRAKAKRIARDLFPHAYSCRRSPEALARARRKLFELLDQRAP